MSFFDVFVTRLSQCAPHLSKVNIRYVVLIAIINVLLLVPVVYNYAFTTTVNGVRTGVHTGVQMISSSDITSSRQYHLGLSSTNSSSQMQTSLLMNSLSATFNVSDTTPTVHDQSTQSGDVAEVRVATLMENVSSNGEADVEKDHDSQSVLLCPMNKPFLVYVYDTPGNSGLQNSEVMASLIKDLQLGNSWTDDPVSACIFVLVIGPWSEAVSPEDVNSLIHSLPHWQTYSNRHVLVELSPSNSKSRPFSMQIKTGAALVATSYFSTQHINYTLIPPLLTKSVYHNILPPTEGLIAKTRKMFMYFEGEMENYKSSESGLTVVNICHKFTKRFCSLKCRVRREEGALDNEWSLCNNAADRLRICQQAVFALVPCGSEGEVGPASFTRLLEALECGAVPVVVGNCDNGQLPFGEVIEWKDLAIFTPSKELPAHLMLKNRKNLRKYRQRGLFIYNNYFSSELRIVESLIAIVRSHSNHPPMWYSDYIPNVLVNTMTRIAAAPIVRNITKYEYSESVWNTSPGPFYSQNSHLANQSFSEKFTIVILTYHREKDLLQLVWRLKNCPFLDKVVIVWNNEQNRTHPKQYKWPNIGSPIEVVRGKGNTLNNRFLPLSNIETDAVLSIDDDVCLTQQQIVQGFRVWQSHRMAIVGWMSRTYRLYSNSSSGKWSYEYWYYGSDCEYSMVMTNGAFIHKYYTYLYTYWMPESVRSFVHQHFNCEDIAMNFLVSHITGQPPVTIGNKRSPECKEAKKEIGSIHARKGHITTRSQCLNEFERAYGYMPLRKSKFQAVKPWCTPKKPNIFLI